MHICDYPAKTFQNFPQMNTYLDADKSSLKRNQEEDTESAIVMKFMSVLLKYIKNNKLTESTSFLNRSDYYEPI